MDQQIRDRRVLHQDLSVAIKNGELLLYFQPQAMSGATVAESDIIASNRYDGLRISFQVYNTVDDVKAVTEGLKKNLNLMLLDRAGVGSYD